MAALVCGLVVALALGPGAATAADSGAGDTVVGSNETVDGDLSATTGDVVVHGTVEGDVSAVAGSVRVTGEVTDDVSASAGSVTVEGSVGDDVSAAAGSVDVVENATVGGDVSAGAGSVELGPGARVEGDASAGAGSVVVPANSTVGGDVTAGGGDARIDGTVEGSVTTGGTAVLGSTAVVEGGVTYREDIDRAEGATVHGSVEHDPDNDLEVTLPLVNPSPPSLGGGLVPGVVPEALHVVYWTLVALLIGAGLLALFPRFTADVATQASTDPVRSGAAGFAAIVGVPFVLFAVFMTVIGIPVAIAGAAVFVLVAWAGLVYGAYLAGRQLLGAAGTEDQWLALAVGVVGVELLSQIPLLGGLLKFVVLLVGLGATALAIADRWNDDGNDAADEGPTEPHVPDPAPGTA